MIDEVLRRVVVRRRGITVRARAVGKYSKKTTLYAYTDANGVEHEYKSRLSVADIDVTYDPEKPSRAASRVSSAAVVPKLVSMAVASAFCLFVAYHMVLGMLG
ncbi:hypothetical protein J7E96_16920 [Streptomyces sp. ISL-96]|uniref:hypothetical protein n=1 Tax=Streptomyces sp. ISL-96 TaxID=2819191 RepID=UPI001BE73D46|nr:hypothetical protein [Streptomyces sp. ISL-96]MBT2490170.1 hypothetical protein [Streptomyces sp. ISL-96]